MAKKTTLTKSLETAQKNAVRELANTRKRIRKQKKINSLEYGILHEETVADAKKAGKLIDEFIAKLNVKPGTALVLIQAHTVIETLLLAVVDTESVLLLPDGRWQMTCRKYVLWDDARSIVLQTMEFKGPEITTFDWPLHRLLGTSGAFISCGEKDVAKRLLPSKEKSDGDGTPPERFNLFYELTQQLGHELRNDALQKRVVEERERVTNDCGRHLKSIACVLDELFVHGPRKPYHNFTGDPSPLLVKRAHGLSQEMSMTMRECRLYGVETDESREIAAFGKRWITYFTIWDHKT